MKNSEVIDSIIVCCDIDKDIKYDKERVNDSPIDIKEWLKKYSRYNVSNEMIIRIVLSLIEADNDKSEELYKYERYMEFFYKTFSNRKIVDGGIINNSMLGVTKCINLIIQGYNCNYSKEFGKELSIDNKKYRIEFSNTHTSLYDKEDKLVYESVLGIECDLRNGNIKIIPDNGIFGALRKENNKVKVIL